MLKTLIQEPPTSFHYKRGLYNRGAKAPLKIGHVPLRIARYPNGRSMFTISDTHSNQTNSAYSRNEYGGGFFTR
jgi:hypothetical protein